MNKALGAVFGFVGAILLLLPVAAFAGPQLPGEPTGTHTFCSGTQSGQRAVTIGSALGRVQPIRAHNPKGTPCTETLSITDTRVNISVIGDGGDTLNFGRACLDPNNTKLVGEDPSQAQIIQVRGRNITITGIEIIGNSINAIPAGFLNNNLGLFNPTDFTAVGCPVGASPLPGGFGDANANNGACNNNRGIRAQRGGILLVGRHTTFGGFLPVLTAGNHNPRQYEEKTGVCIHHVSKNGIEATQSSTLRVINTEIHDVGGDAINISETSTTTIGFSSGTELNLTSDPFPGQGNGGPNFLFNNTGNGIAVQRNSYARIVGNTIQGNNLSGINVTRGAGSDVADNVINANSQFGVALNDNSQVNLGTTGSGVCSLVPAGNTVPASTGGPHAGGVGPALPSPAGNQCPGAGTGSGVQNTGTTGSGTINLGNLSNTVTVANGSSGISCVRSYIAGRSTANRAALAVATGLSGNSGGPASVFTTCVSNLN